MMAPLELDVDAELKTFSFTRKAHRDVYPAIEPSRPDHSQVGKVIIVTGASRGIGKLVRGMTQRGIRNCLLVLLTWILPGFRGFICSSQCCCYRIDWAVG